jgi:hypothetical protein
MDIAPTLSEQLGERNALDTTATFHSWLRRSMHGEPPQLEDWLRYWDDGDTDVGNLRNLEHWLTRTRTVRSGG